MSDEELKRAIELVKSGDKVAAKSLLIRMVRNDPYDEQAWLWLATVTDEEHRIYCLQKAVAINPQNEQAREYLNKLNPQTSLHEIYSDSKPQKDIAWEPEQPIGLDFYDEDEEEYEDEYEYEYETADFTAYYNEKYLRSDGAMVFKPRRDGMLIFASLFLAVILIAVFIVDAFLTDNHTNSDLYLVMLSLPMLMMIYGLFVKISGVYNIVIENSIIRGPKLEMYPWVKEELQLQHIDLNKTQTSFGFMGRCLIFSSKGPGIFVFGFDRDTFNDLFEYIWVMKVREANTISEQTASLPGNTKRSRKSPYEALRGIDQTMQRNLPRGEIVFKPNRRHVLLTRTLPGMILTFLFMFYMVHDGIFGFGFLISLFYILIIVLHYLYRVSPWFNITITDTELKNDIPMLYGGYDRNSILIKDIVLKETIKNWRGATFIRTGEWDSVEVRGYTRKEVANIVKFIEHRQTESYQQWVQDKYMFSRSE